ncbi:sigma-70 family RNA polymerase sigma factor [Nocardia yunnanensis]|uniref:Sigma-70 family RNA polymerase sigma factor n=1 Tax=Nocardia yunnanensis TaxID=2382165 RepID=A0A386ZJM9_9NOCA|nr:sigma-70 family RNA polymerase sigma factor [Nocardia yunnanensis]AYF77787.1 sigma-70 family RNA polymerase sigma factor [Nocardia yunnanensis]
MKTSRASQFSAARFDHLVGRIAHGDRDAYAELYRRTRGLVYARVLNIVCDTGYAEETCHEVYLQVWRSAGGFDPARGSALTWLSTLAHHQAVDRVRRECSAAGHEHRWGVGDYRPAADVVAEEILRRQEERAIRLGLATLTPYQRESVVLAFYGGLTYAQVAARLGIGLPAVKARIRSGLAQLKTALA